MKKAYSDVLAFMRAGRQDIGDLTKPAVPRAAVSLGVGVNLPGDGYSLLAHHAYELHRMAECWKQSGQGVTALRARLMLEELGETLEAMSNGDVVGTADGLADLVYVVVGAAVAYGIDLGPVWAEVSRSNMAKYTPCDACGELGKVDAEGKSIRGPKDPDPNVAYAGTWTGKKPVKTCEQCAGTGLTRLLDENGKVRKPEGWTPPDIAAVIARQRQRAERAATIDFNFGADPEHIGADFDADSLPDGTTLIGYMPVLMNKNGDVYAKRDTILDPNDDAGVRIGTETFRAARR